MSIHVNVPVPQLLCLYEVDLSLLFQDEVHENTNRTLLTHKKSLASIISNNLLNESYLLKSLSADRWHGLYVQIDPIESWKKLDSHSLTVYCAIDQIKMLEYRENRLAMEPMKFNDITPSSERLDALEFRTVACNGVLDEKRSIYVGPRSRSISGVTENGYYVITPLLPIPNNPERLCLLYEVDLSLLFQYEVHEDTNRKLSLTHKKSLLLNESYLLKSLSADRWHGLYVLIDTIESWKKLDSHSLTVYFAIDQLTEEVKEADQPGQENGYHHAPINVFIHHADANGYGPWGDGANGNGAGGDGANGNGPGGDGANGNGAGGDGANGNGPGGDGANGIRIVLRNMSNNQIETHVGDLPRNIQYEDYDEVESRICEIIEEFQGQHIDAVMFEYFIDDGATHNQIEVDPLVIDWQVVAETMTRIIAAVVFVV